MIEALLTGTTSYVLGSLAWSLGGFVIGYLVGAIQMARKVGEMEMTTPERQRRRQLIIGTFVLLLAVGTIIQAGYFRAQDISQRECMEEKFREFSEVLSVRADLTQRESKATSGVIDAFVEAAAVSEQPPAVRDEARQRIVDSLDTYAQEMAAVRRIRRDNPVPNFPAGECKRR